MTRQLYPSVFTGDSQCFKKFDFLIFKLSFIKRVFIIRPLYMSPIQRSFYFCDRKHLRSKSSLFAIRPYLYKSALISNGLSKSFNIACFVSFSERLACSVGIFQSIPRVSSRMLMPPSASG